MLYLYNTALFCLDLMNILESGDTGTIDHSYN